MSPEERKASHTAVSLWEEHHAVRPYPKGIVEVRRAIPGVAFFPGGYGLYRESIALPLPEWPSDGVMVVGQDFHTVEGYESSLSAGREPETQPTWKNLLDLLKRTGIDSAECFFTNAYMGLRKDGGATGRFPGARDPEFADRCSIFFERQVDALQPRLILCLGAWVPEFVARRAHGLNHWRSASSLKRIDEVGPLVREVSIGGCSGITVIALTHPSFRRLNVRRRRFDGREGDDAEKHLIASALGIAG